MTRLISAIEARAPRLDTARAAIHADGGQARVVGVTGAPGSGKSTLIDSITAELRHRGKSVAVVAVDPSSALTGGALLGDRIRMARHTLDPGVLVRSMSSRGAFGGLARATSDVVALLDAVGWEYVLVETVGVGQAEVDIMKLADTVTVVTPPGLGDDIQAIKAGLLEVADIHVVNKADLPDAKRTASDLLFMLKMGDLHGGAWSVPVMMTEALTAQGVSELVDAFGAHQRWLDSSGEGLRRRRKRMADRLNVLVRDRLMERIENPCNMAVFEEMVDRVVGRAISPQAAVDALIDNVRVQV
jgi:LAO/AO transport system kinase